MNLDSVLLPDFYSGGNNADLYVHHFASTTPHIRHNIVLTQNLICLLMNGTKEVFGPHQSIKIDNQELLLMSSGSTIMLHSRTAESTKLESILFFFTDNLLREFCLKHKLDFSTEGESAEAVVALRKDEFLLNFEASLKLLEGENYSALQKLKLEELLVYLALKNRSGKFYSFVRNALSNATHEKLRHVVAANCTNGLSVEELSFLCDMSVSTFKRHFVKAFKCSPKKYLKHKRMERARELLRMNARPSEIYTDLRYNSLSSFSTEFKKYFGLSPKQFKSHDLVSQT